MNADINVRGYTRISLKIDLEMERLSDHQIRTGKTENISISGLFVHLETPYLAGSECIVRLFVPGSDNEVLVHSKVRVVYTNALGMGVQFVSHLGLESYGHLQKLVLYNADTHVEKIETEINTHLDQLRNESMG